VRVCRRRHAHDEAEKRYKQVRQLLDSSKVQQIPFSQDVHSESERRLIYGDLPETLKKNGNNHRMHGILLEANFPPGTLVDHALNGPFGS
jgi:hypothetical protein